MTAWVRLLGPVSAEADGRPLDLGHARQRGVLAALLVDAGDPVRTDDLIERVWAFPPPQRVRPALHSYLSRLRRALAGVVGIDLVRGGGGYRAVIDPESLDLHRFRQLLASARTAPPEQAADRYGQALRLWHGEPFAGLDTAWFVSQRELLYRQRAAAELDRNDAALALGRHAEVLVEASTALDANPLDERLAAQVMTALYRSGRQADALDVYQRTRLRLADLQGADPSPALQHRYRQILTADAALATPSERRVRVPGEPLVGRDAELDLLRAALADARAGHGRLVLVAGEPGVGKSRLLTEFGTEARSGGARVLWGRAAEEAGAPSYWPWVQVVRAEPSGRAVLRQLVPDSPAPPTTFGATATHDPAAARFRMFDAATTWLLGLAGERPTVVMLDDVHRADVPSLLLLRFVTRAVADTGLLVVAAYRDPPAPAPHFADVLGELVREPVTRNVELRGLDPDGVARLLNRPTEPDLPARIHERTGGNPFFVRELIQQLRGPGSGGRPGGDPLGGVPTGVSAVVRSRVAALAPPAGDVLAAASVLGRDFDVAILAPLCDRSGADLLAVLAEPVTAGLVQPAADRPGAYRFAHILVRDALYTDLPVARRAALHGRVADILRAARGAVAGPHLAEVAHHYLLAAPEVAAGTGVDLAVRAGQFAVRALAFEHGVELFEAALDRLLDETRRCRVLLLLGDARMKAGATDAGRATFEQAADLAGALDEPMLLARAALGYGTAVEFLRGNHAVVERLTGLLHRAMRAIPPGDSAVRVLLLGRLALALYLAPADRQAVARVTRDTVSAEAVAIARRLGDDGVLAHALYARCFATWGRDNLPERAALADELLRVAGDGELLLAARHWQIVNGLETGDVDAVDRHLQAYVRTAAPLGQPFYEYWTCVLRATRALMRARFDEAEALCLRALDLGRQLGSTDTGFANGAAAQFQAVRYEQGRTAELEPMVAAFVEQIPDRLAWRMALAQIYTSMGRLDDARHHFEILARNDFRDVPEDPFWLTAIAGLADVSAILGDVARARLLYDLLQPYRGRFVVVSFGFACFAAVDHHLGVLAHTVGSWERADVHLRAASDAHRRIGLLPALARTARRRAALAADRGTAEAGPLAAEAEKLAAEAGMSWLYGDP